MLTSDGSILSLLVPFNRGFTVLYLTSWVLVEFWDALSAVNPNFERLEVVEIGAARHLSSHFDHLIACLSNAFVCLELSAENTVWKADSLFGIFLFLLLYFFLLTLDSSLSDRVNVELPAHLLQIFRCFDN